MGEVLGHVIEVLGHALVEMFNWIPEHRLNSIDSAWAWPIACFLVLGIMALVAALWLGHPWLYRLALGGGVGALGSACVGAMCSRPPRSR